MSELIVPISRVPVSVRDATLDDVAFIDALQKQHGRQLGFLPRSWIEKRIADRQVLIAQDAASGERLGHIVSQDKYLKREELGLVIQLCVVKDSQRSLIGATLLKTAFDRASYGCRLYCCWCAQDLAANRFWEAMGFVPLAYRAGSERKRRVHIFWQKRVREGDETTPWWFPSSTTGGAMGAGRIVLPIPPGKTWADEMPVILLPGTEPGAPRQLESKEKRPRANAVAPQVAKPQPLSGALCFAPAVSPTGLRPAKETKPKAKAKVDPKLLAAARELRDRWLERLNESPLVAHAKYEVSRALEAPSSPRALKQLPAAA